MPQENIGCVTCETPTTPCPVTQLSNGASLGGYSFGSACSGSNPTPISTQNILFPNGGEYYVERYIDMIRDTTIPLFKAYVQAYPAVAQLLFDFDTLYDPTRVGTSIQTSLTFKSFPSTELELAADGKSFVWAEYREEEPEVYVARDEPVPTNKILLADEAGNPFNMANCNLRTKDLFMPGSVILIYTNDPNSTSPDCCAKLEQRTIIAVNPSVTWNGRTYIELTLEPGPHLITAKGRNEAPNTILPHLNGRDGSVYKGDRIHYLYDTRNDCDVIINTFQQTPMKMKQSFIQHVGATMTLTKTELNRKYSDQEGVNAFLSSRLFGLQKKLVKQVVHAFYFGRNTPGDPSVVLSGVTNPNGSPRYKGSETMGVFPMLFNAHQMKPHLGLITSAAALQTDDDYVRLILDQILAAQNARVLAPGTPITMVMDRVATTKFLKLNNAWNKFTGITVFRNDNVKKDFTLAAIQTPNGPVEIMTCYELGELTNNTGTILIMPKSHVMLKTRENQKYIPNGQIEKAQHGFRFEDVTLKQINGTECNQYIAYTEFAIILGMIDSGAWRLITNFR